MQDHAMVKSLQIRRAATLAAVYDTYARPLYGYCRLLLCDEVLAEVALRDTFLVAELRIDELGDPERLKTWLFAIARGEATRRRTAGDAQGCGSGALSMALRSMAPRSMAETAVAALDPAEREALELAERYGLREADVALVLDLPLRRTHALLARAHHHLRRALTAVILARTGREYCRRLAALTEADGRLDAARCRRVGRHAAVCRTCGPRGSHRASATKVLNLLPSAELPAGLRWQILSSYADPALIGYRLHVARRVGALDPAGFPLPMNRRRRAGRLRAAAAAATCLFVVAATVLGTTGIRPRELPQDLPKIFPDGRAWLAWPYLPSPSGVGGPSPQPSPSTVPYGVQPAVGSPAAARGPVFARPVPTPPAAAATDAAWARGGRSGTPPASRFEGRHLRDTGGSPTGPPSQPPSGWPSAPPSGSPSATPSGSPSGGPARSSSESSHEHPREREDSSERGNKGENGRGSERGEERADERGNGHGAENASERRGGDPSEGRDESPGRPPQS